jgi:rubrerythrin
MKMSKSTKGTKTEKNLMAAFAGESQARNRYNYFANAARSSPTKVGYEQIGNIFNDTAENEKVHAKVFLKYLEEGDVEITVSYAAIMVKDTLANLESAANGENKEWSSTYVDFAKTAKEEGFPEIASSFEQIAKAEKFHESRFRKLLANVKAGEVYRKKTAVAWHCSNCGFVQEGIEAPKECPACKHPQYYYEVLAENY